MNAHATELTARQAAASAQWRQDLDSRAYELSRKAIRASAENTIIDTAKAAFGIWAENALLRLAYDAMPISDPRRDMLRNLLDCKCAATHGAKADQESGDAAEWFLEQATEFAHAVQSEAE